jgi:hypothetical protein
MAVCTPDELVAKGRAFYADRLKHGDAPDAALAATIKEAIAHERRECIAIVKSWAGHIEQYGSGARTVREMADDIRDTRQGAAKG